MTNLKLFLKSKNNRADLASSESAADVAVIFDGKKSKALENALLSLFNDMGLLKSDFRDMLGLVISRGTARGAYAEKAGPDSARRAAKNAVISLQKVSAHSKKPDSLLIHFWLGGDITMKELAETMDYLSAAFPASHLFLKQIVAPEFLGKSACMLIAFNRAEQALYNL